MLDLTKEQIQLLISLAEMALDGSGCTFGDWRETNPEAIDDLERAEQLMRRACEDYK